MSATKWPYAGLPEEPAEKLTEADFPTYEQSMTQPWRFPQGRLPASHPARITPPEDDDPWCGVRLSWPKMLRVVALYAGSLVAAIAVLWAVFS